MKKYIVKTFKLLFDTWGIPKQKLFCRVLEKNRRELWEPGDGFSNGYSYCGYSIQVKIIDKRIIELLKKDVCIEIIITSTQFSKLSVGSIMEYFYTLGKYSNSVYFYTALDSFTKINISKLIENEK